MIHVILAKSILYNERDAFERILHNIPINWITGALSQTSTLYYSAYLAVLCVNLHPVNITNNIAHVPIVATIRYKSISEN